MATISKVIAREILDSRGIPTIESAMFLDSGVFSVCSVPAGTSTGTYEALELRDLDNTRFLGKGVLKAVENVNSVLGPSVTGMDPSNQKSIDDKLLSQDSTENKSKLGANSILAVSMAATKLGAISQGQPLYLWIASVAQKAGLKVSVKIPTPLFNMINGGKHGAGNLDFQEFHVIPASSKIFSDSLRMGAEIYMIIGDNLARRGAIHSVGDEGGYAPNLFTNADALEILVEAIKQSQYALGRDVQLGLDVAANTFYRAGEYLIKDRSSPMDENQIIEYYKGINEQYNLAILEDPLHEDAWNGWSKMQSTLGDHLTIVGDDLLVTNPKRVKKAIDQKACNGILVKPNQIGTVTETLSVIKIAKDANWKIIVSHRSGETNDAFIADFAVGLGADYFKFGAPARGERVAKYNRLLAIESEFQNVPK